jgi:hypothetical protein
MAISPDPTVPDIIYLDEQAVSDAFSFMGQGTVSEIVERTLSEDESTKEGGLNKVLIGRLASRDMEASETEIVRQLDPIGQLAMLREVLADEDLLQTPSTDFSMAERDNLQRGQVLEFDCTLRQTPIERLQQITNRFIEFKEVLGSYAEINEEDAEEVDEVRELLSALSREGNVLRAVLSDEAACDFILTYDGGDFRNKPLEFP